jgi:hypothetical protein
MPFRRFKLAEAGLLKPEGLPTSRDGPICESYPDPERSLAAILAAKTR